VWWVGLGLGVDEYIFGEVRCREGKSWQSERDDITVQQCRLHLENDDKLLDNSVSM